MKGNINVLIQFDLLVVPEDCPYFCEGNLPSIVAKT